MAWPPAADKAAHFLAGMALAALLVPFVLGWSLLPVVLAGAAKELRATPALWIGSTDADFSQSLVVYGFYKDFYISIDYPTMALSSLEIEGQI